MAAIALPLLTLSQDERSIIAVLQRKVFASRSLDIKHERYYEGRQRLALLGIAVPPELAGFETVANWNRVVVDEPERRMDVRAFVREPDGHKPTVLVGGALALGSLQYAEQPQPHRIQIRRH